jgi:cell shape-determining protein MreC
VAGLLVVLGTLKPVRSVFSNIFSPLFKSGNYFYDKFGQIPKYFSDKDDLVEENNLLRSQSEDWRLAVLDYESLKYENQKLREELKLKPIDNFVAVAVTAKPPQVPLDSIFIDTNFDNNLEEGGLVLASDRVMIGKIAEKSGNQAIVKLNSFVGQISYGYVARTNEPVEVEGVGGGNLEVRVPIDFDIIVGDKIMVGGSSEYLIAVVGVVDEDSSSGFKNAMMSLPVDISKIGIVFVCQNQ